MGFFGGVRGGRIRYLSSYSFSTNTKIRFRVEKSNTEKLTQLGDISKTEAEKRILKLKSTLIQDFIGWIVDYEDTANYMVAGDWTFETAPTTSEQYLGFNLGARHDEAMLLATKYANGREIKHFVFKGIPEDALYKLKYSGRPATGSEGEVELLFAKGRLVQIDAHIDSLNNINDMAALAKAMGERYKCRFSQEPNPYNVTFTAINGAGVELIIEPNKTSAYYTLLQNLDKNEVQQEKEDKYEALLNP